MTTAGNWSTLKRLYSEALDCAPAEREAFLQRACMQHPSLGDELRALLADDSEDRFLEPPPEASSHASGIEPPGEFLGRQVGPYRIDRMLGTGGMGNVYLATRAEGDFRRQVAAKIIKRGMDTDSLVRQFQRERQALAMLDHPHVARLYDGGATGDGRPYLIMEYIAGEPIDTYCARMKLSTRQRLSLFVAVCEGVAYAHRHLIVHRDLKPANILVTPEGVPKLLDFGIAKILSDSDCVETTRPMDRRLTPEYASPEQVSGGPISTATDIYSLGVILYELLTARRPYHFNTRSPHDIESTICKADPLPPSVAVTRKSLHDPKAVPRDPASSPSASETVNGASQRLSRVLRGDLDTIVLTALKKDTTRRYPSIESFAGDVQRYLAGLPITARKDTLAYRAQKFVGRHRAATFLGILANVMVIAGGLAILRYAHIADQERDLAGTARDKAQQSAQVASQQRDEAYAARDEAEAIADFFNDALAAADPAIAGPTITVRALLDDAVNQISASLAGRPQVQAGVRSTIGRTYAALGLYDLAETQLQAAFEQRRTLLGDDHHDVAESRTDLASLRYAQGRLAEAESLLRQSLAAHERLRGEQNIDTARVCNDLGAVLRAAGKLDEAMQMNRRALATHEKAGGHDSLPVAMSLNNLGAIHRARRENSEAEKIQVESLRIRRKLLPVGHPLVIQSLHNLGLTRLALGRLDQAEQLLREAVILGESAMGRDHPDLAIILRSLAGILVQQQNFTDALPLFQRAKSIFDGRYPAAHPRRITTHADLAYCLVKLSRYDEAERLLLALLESCPAQQLNEQPWRNAVTDLIELYERTHRQAEADVWRQKLRGDSSITKTIAASQRTPQTRPVLGP